MQVVGALAAAILFAVALPAYLIARRGRRSNRGFEWSADLVIAHLSRHPFGDSLARKVSEQLVAQSMDGGLYFRHRDYCGHGLIFRNGQFLLVEVLDGAPEHSKVLASWDSPGQFTQELAAWSDYACSGADPAHPIFAAQQAFDLNNQRITRERLVAFVAER